MIAEDCHGPHRTPYGASGLAMTDCDAFAQNTNLKKQSQFYEDRINISVYLIYIYRELCAFLWLKNKANQSQLPAFGRKSEALSSKSENNAKTVEDGHEMGIITRKQALYEIEVKYAIEPS